MQIVNGFTIFTNSLHHRFLAASLLDNAQKMKFTIKVFFSECDQIIKKLRIWSHLLKKFLMENFIFCTVTRQVVFCEKAKLIFSPKIHRKVHKVESCTYLDFYRKRILLKVFSCESRQHISAPLFYRIYINDCSCKKRLK